MSSVLDQNAIDRNKRLSQREYKAEKKNICLNNTQLPTYFSPQMRKMSHVTVFGEISQHIDNEDDLSAKAQPSNLSSCLAFEGKLGNFCLLMHHRQSHG